jgi:hypothetical protein
MVVRRKR